MVIGQFIRIIEIIVTIYCGVKLAVCPGQMRWDNKIVKVVFGLCILAITICDIINTFMFKFSSIGTVAFSAAIFIILLIFYDTYFWQILVQYTIYWYSVLLFNYIVICASCVQQSVSIEEYLNESYNVDWDWIHIIGMLLTVTASLIIFKIRNGTPLIMCKFKRKYIGIALVLLIEVLMGEILFNRNITTDVINKNYFIISVLIVWLLFSILLIILVFKAYKDTKHENLISEMNFQMLQKQYGLLQDMYTIKRRQVHDSTHHDIIVMEYLRNNNCDAALAYMEEKMEKASLQQKHRYTGLSVIDLMLDYKINEAEKYNIQMTLDIDVYFCPIDDTEMCVLLGNLLDNAIEATKNLSSELRKIDVSMRNPNSIFIVEIKNPFIGKRKKVSGQYLTTKPDKELHGLGLDSVRKIVEKNDGFMEIEDDGQQFTVVVTLFGKRRNLNKNR